ncbi:hypothetical protein [Geodermatophilus sp. SYSU D01119]
MTTAERTDMTGSWLPWWRRVLCQQDFVKAVVLGARKTGKTTFFRALAEQPATTDPVPHKVVYWPVRRVARRQTTTEVRAALWRLLGVDATQEQEVADDPGFLYEYMLNEAMQAAGAPITLVVDDWDGALDAGGSAVPDACYEVLDELCRYVALTQRSVRGEGPRFGLVLLTSLPEAEDLKVFAREVQRPAFERLSGLVCRNFDPEVFPHLTDGDARGLLRDRGLTDEDADRVLVDCGGWLGLLELAAEAAEAEGGWTPEARRRVSEETLPSLLRTSLYPVLARRAATGSSRQSGADYLARRLGAEQGDRFGFPHGVDGSRFPAVIAGHRLRRYLVVDTENLIMAYERDMTARPAVYGHQRLRTWLPAALRPVIEELAAGDPRTGIPTAEVVLVGRSRERIAEGFGADAPGRRLYVDAGSQRPSRKDGTDDLLLSSWIAQREVEAPHTEFLLLSGDQDAPVALRSLVRNLVICTPWRAAGVLTDNDLPEGWSLRQRCLYGLPEPERWDSWADAQAARRQGAGARA